MASLQLYTSIGCGCRNYCVINFVSHVEMVLIKIQSNNLNTARLTTWGRAGTGEGGDQGHYRQSAAERPLYFDDVVQMTFRM